MRLITISTIALMCSTGLALAAENPSGRPGKVLNEQQCEQAWQAAGGSDSGALSKAKAKRYILNFAQVDTSSDRKISADEWKAGCNMGWVSADAREVTPKNSGAAANDANDDTSSDHNPAANAQGSNAEGPLATDMDSNQ